MTAAAIESAGAKWAQKIYDEKLAKKDFVNLGAGFSDELCAARSVAAIAHRKLYLPGIAAGTRVINPELPKHQRVFWTDVIKHASQLCIEAEQMIEKQFNNK